jgi:hypothetical protein
VKGSEEKELEGSERRGKERERERERERGRGGEAHHTPKLRKSRTNAKKQS